MQDDQKAEFANSLELPVNNYELKPKISLTQPHWTVPLTFLTPCKTCSTTSTIQTQMFLQPHRRAGHLPSVLSSACSNLCSFSPLSPCHVFINMRLFLVFFPSVFILDFILTYLLTFSFHLMVLLLNVWYHKRLNTSVYEMCPSGVSRLAFISCNEILYFWDQS